MVEENGKNGRLLFKIMVLFFAIMILISFEASLQSRSDPIGIQVMPEVVKEGQPIVVTFYLNNPSDKPASEAYSLYANGEAVMSGIAVLKPQSGRQFQYVYKDALKIGEQVTFVGKVKSDVGSYESSLFLPAYPPQVWSSFVSFASFSTSVMSTTSAISSMSMSSMAYYDQSFSGSKALNAGIVISIVLIILLIYMELSEPLLAEKRIPVIGSLRIRFARLAAILFVIFLGMVFTQIALIVGGAR